MYFSKTTDILNPALNTCTYKLVLLCQETNRDKDFITSAREIITEIEYMSLEEVSEATILARLLLAIEFWEDRKSCLDFQEHMQVNKIVGTPAKIAATMKYLEKVKLPEPYIKNGSDFDHMLLRKVIIKNS